MFFISFGMSWCEHNLNKKLFKDNEDIEFDKDDMNVFSQPHYND
jgi:hypothetical protein